jgi:hypothetical protein
MLNKLPKRILLMIAKRVKIPEYDNKDIRKKTIINALNAYFKSVVIQKWFRSTIAYNENCHITMEPIRYPLWGFKYNNKRHYYNLPDFVHYLITRGDFRDPVSREPITKEQVKEISKIYDCIESAGKLDLLNVYESQLRFDTERVIDEQAEILEDTLRNIVTELVEDLIIIETYIDSEETIDVNEMLGPNVYELRLCSEILSNICNQTHIRVINWAITEFEQIDSISEEVNEIVYNLILSLERELENNFI